MSLDLATQARLVGLFVDEAEEALRELAAAHLRLAGAHDEEELRTFGRTAHGLKGAAAALGFEPLARLLHDLEEVSLGLSAPAGAGRAGTHGRLGLALQRLEAGLAHMAAAGLSTFPEQAVRGAAEALQAPVGQEAPPVTPEAPPPPEPGAPPAAEALVERLSVPAAEVDEALRLAASLARAAAQLQPAAPAGDPASLATRSLAAQAERLEALIAGLRLLPAEVALGGLEEEVAALALRLGREVALAIQGRDVRADRRTLQAARGMLRHLVRNALDHGLEPPAQRRAAGKPAEGRLTVRVASADGTLEVAVRDDGAGFDVAAARGALVRRGEEAARVEAWSEAEVLARFAATGGSTRAEVTEVSGRGLGLSAVAALARAAGGSLSVRSERGRGSEVSFALPLDVYAVEALVAFAGGRAFGLPVQALERTVLLAEAGEALRAGPTGRTLAAGEGILPLVGLAEALGLPGPEGQERFALVVRGAEGALALAADEIGEVVALVPSAVPGAAGPGALVSGLSRLADGTTVQVLDPPALLTAARSAARRPRLAPAAAAAPPAAAPAQAPRPAQHHPPARATEPPGPPREVVLAEDSLATREVLRVLLEEQGFRVRLAADGEEALARLREQRPDVLVTDLNMPRRDGLALTRAVRADPALAGLPVVLLTSQDDEPTRTAGALAGADAYLVKSRFGAEVLSATLARIGLGARR